DWYEWLEYTQVLLVDISKEEAIQRLTKRRMCSQCGRIIPFVGKFKEIDKCDKCGGDLITREDDDIEGVKERLGWFDTDVKPVIDYYQGKGKLTKINGEQSIEDVFEDVLKALKK
ncbi:MAG: adenylate kinase, partial [Candidatus Nealsonbacteria bacterium]|nr:adenylate kinase [Candidatus Nealsonbacteria bacterium]